MCSVFNPHVFHPIAHPWDIFHLLFVLKCCLGFVGHCHPFLRGLLFAGDQLVAYLIHRRDPFVSGAGRFAFTSAAGCGRIGVCIVVISISIVVAVVSSTVWSFAAIPKRVPHDQKNVAFIRWPPVLILEHLNVECPSVRFQRVQVVESVLLHI